MTTDRHNSIRLAAVGDLLLTADPGGGPSRGLEALSCQIRDLFASCDLVFANLESTLPGKGRVPTEPLVLSSEKQIQSLKDSGINIVTLGNNHAFDCLDEGFQKLTDVLNGLDIPWCGAGLDYEEASRPIIAEVNGVSVALLGVVDKSSGPYSFADDSTSGVVSLNVERICQSIKNLKEKVDHVVISPHWGMERFRIPSLEQIEQAHAFVDANASMVLGHHPHVPQGLEFYSEAPIAYSMGNFLANTVYWSHGDHLTWSRFEQTGMILLAEINTDSVLNVEQIPVFDDGVTISIDKSGQGDQYLKKVNHLLSRGVTEKSYRREKFYVQTVKPIVAQLKWSKLKRVRPGHFNKLLKLFSQ
ncbi:MAG: CapA family protein [Deltaproteobacteria bacterium]|nr:MAG: CapA family protein [Deltaproteobacteria bacterium]